MKGRRGMKKILIAACVFAAAMAASAAQAAGALPDKMAVTYVKSPLNVPSIVERAQKRFEAEFPGVRLEFPELTEGPKQTAALAAGEIAFAACLGSTSAILAASEGMDLRIIGVYSRAPKALMILVKDPSIKKVADLKGKKIAGPKGTILHQLLAAALAQEGMGMRDVEFISMDIPSSAAALGNGGVSAALLAGPAAENALRSGARTLRNGEGLTSATIVVATTGKFMKQYPSAVEGFLKVHRETLAWIAANPEEAKRLAQKATGLSKESVDAMYGWYDFDMRIKKSDIEELERTQEFMLENGLQRKRIDISSILAAGPRESGR